MRPAILALLLAAPAGCAVQAPPAGSTVSAVLPGRYVQTDGHGDLILLAGGGAHCAALAPAEAAAALQATNAQRATRGLAPLRAQHQLQAVADAHACEMARRGTMTHRGTRSTGPGARLRAQGYQSRVAAENIAAGRFTLPQVLGEWSRSGGHVANITRPDVTDFALGRAIGADGRTSFWAAVYAGR